MFKGLKTWDEISRDFELENGQAIQDVIVINESDNYKPNLKNKRIALELNIPSMINKHYRLNSQGFDKANEIMRTICQDKIGSIIVREGVRLNNSKYRRWKRLALKIKSMLNDEQGQVLFLTLTFTDSVLDNTTIETRRKYVRRYLKDNCIKYVANIDYGAKNEREHYHACVLVNGNIDYTKWQYGALNGQKVRVNVKDTEVKLAKYIAKLTNHAIKETTKNSAIIYSRN